MSEEVGKEPALVIADRNHRLLIYRWDSLVSIAAIAKDAQPIESSAGHPSEPKQPASPTKRMDDCLKAPWLLLRA
jgi:hypothetical protein